MPGNPPPIDRPVDLIDPVLAPARRLPDIPDPAGIARDFATLAEDLRTSLLAQAALGQILAAAPDRARDLLAELATPALDTVLTAITALGAAVLIESATRPTDTEETTR